MDLECTLVPAKLAAELAEVVEAARHEGREPAAGLVLALVELTARSTSPTSSAPRA